MSELREWIKKYNKKAPEPFERDKRYELFFRPDKGFCEIASNGKMLIINQMCGDIKYWRNAIEQVCRAMKLQVIGTYCIRNIIPYLKLTGFSVSGVQETEDGLRYFCEDFETGQRGTASPAWIMPNGKRAYYLTFEVT